MASRTTPSPERLSRRSGDMAHPATIGERTGNAKCTLRVEFAAPALNHAVMPALPLTHHDILELVAPFTRRGRQVDLAASDRLARRLVFKPVAHPGESAATPGLEDTLTLESLGTGTCVLTRLLTRDGGAKATLTVLGPDPGTMLADLETVPPQDQFRSGAGFVIARSYSLEPLPGRPGPHAPAMQPLMTRSVAQIDGLTLTMTVPATRGVSADLQLSPAPGENLQVPEDLLAVLGWDWARLIPNADGWKTKRRLRGGPLARTRAAEAAIESAAAHVARTLAASPAGFHERWAGARWGVFCRRAIPVLTLVALLLIVAGIPHWFGSRKPALLMLAFHVPTALIALSFCLQELPQYEIPPVPRPLRAGHWRRPPTRTIDAGPVQARA